MTQKIINDPQIARLMEQVLADSEESAQHRLRHHSKNEKPGMPSTLFSVTRLPKSHPLYSRADRH